MTCHSKVTGLILNLGSLLNSLLDLLLHLLFRTFIEKLSSIDLNCDRVANLHPTAKVERELNIIRFSLAQTPVAKVNNFIFV